jgi:hypothetical protein
MPSDSERIGTELWAAELAKADSRGDIDVMIQCKVMGVPELLAAPRKDRDLFGSIVLNGDPEIITTDVMRATIAYKWQAYGRRLWIQDLVRYFILCGCCITGCNLLVRMPPDCAPWQHTASRASRRSTIVAGYVAAPSAPTTYRCHGRCAHSTHATLRRSC